MIPKRTLFISAVLTAFALATLGGVAMAVKQSSSIPTPASTPPPTSAPVVAAATATATTVALSPQDAAALASNVINDKQMYSVESSPINGVNAYKVVFSSGSVVFVGLDGQILSVTQAPPAVVAQSTPTQPPVLAAPAPVFSVPAAAPSYSEHEHEGGGDN